MDSNHMKLIFYVLALTVCITLMAACDKTEVSEKKDSDTSTTTVADTEPETTSLTTPEPETTPATTSATTPEPKVTKRIVITGGRPSVKFFSSVVSLAGKEQPKVVVLTAAKSDDPGSVMSNVGAFRPYTKNIEAVTPCTKKYDPAELRQKILDADIIYECGGDSETMGNIWKTYGIDEYLREAYENGTLCCGSSAGGMAWAYAGWNDFIRGCGKEYGFYYGLDLIHVYYGPHYDSAEEWRLFDGALKKEENPKCSKGYAMTNGAILVFEDGEVVYGLKENNEAMIKEFTYSDGKWKVKIFKNYK